MINSNVSQADKDAGVVAISETVYPCPICGRDTNTFYKNPVDGKRHIVCSSECADNIQAALVLPNRFLKR